jgi:hypothetical protein
MYDNYFMLNATLFTRGSIHQGDGRFSNISRGRQCAFMTLSALLCANCGNISKWTTQTVDRLLAEGDSMFLKAFEERSVPDEETISLNYLQDRVLWFTMTQNQSPNEANDPNQSPDEANDLDLHSALMNTFSNDNYAFMILDGYTMALIKHTDNVIYVFDSHARNDYGMLDDNGTAVVMKCCDLTTLEQYLRSLSIELSSEFFEIMPVQFVSNTSKSPTHQLMSTNNKNLCTRKVVEFSECKEEKNIEKTKKRKLPEETPRKDENISEK